MPNSDETLPSNPDPEIVATSDDNPSPYGDFEPGTIAPFDYSPNDFVTLSDDAKKAIYELVLIASRTDVASRRFEVEQSWEARLFDRGYQHLMPRKSGGWSLPGENTSWGANAIGNSSSLHATNIYGRDKDIICAAIARETPQITFFPNDPDNIADVHAADAANKYKEIYIKNNNMRDILSQIAYYYYTDDRVVLYTRLVLDKQKYGVNPDGSPKGREVTTVYGKLEGKVPIPVQDQRDMQFVQIYNEIDVAVAKAKYPWAAKDIRPGSTGIGEIELDKIARVNARLALLGSYVTGDSLMRDVTEQMTWFRPEMFYDPSINETVQQELLEAFPDGALVVYAGQTFCFARNESMDEHIHVSHAMPGNGQNRRALGTNNLPIQKRLNAYLDVMDDFFRKTVPRRLYDNDAFDVTALKSQDNVPGGSVPVQQQPGKSLSDLVYVEPTPQPQPALADFVNLYFEVFPASIVGAVPALFGASTNTDTVGGIAIQRDSALGRIGVPWNSAKEAITRAAHQAVLAAAYRQDTIKDTLQNGVTVSIDPELLKGNVVCYPEYDQSFPESWRERELRYTELAQNAPQNPFYAELLKDTRNMRAIADNIRMADLHIPGEDSVKKQLVEIEILKTSAPLPNPAKQKSMQQLQQIQMGMKQDIDAGVPVPPEAAQMMQQAQQMVQSMPDMIPFVEVEQDESVNHAVEAQTCFDWINSEEGQKFKNGTAEEKLGFQDVMLHWQGHTEMAKKLAPQPPTQPPHVSIPFDKLPTGAAAEAVNKAGLHASPDDVEKQRTIATNHKIAEKIVPKTVPESINIHKMTRGGGGGKPPAPGNDQNNGQPVI